MTANRSPLGQEHALASTKFSVADHRTWRQLYERQDHCRRDLADAIFTEGLASLGITGDGIPELAEVNRRLARLTGWRGVFVNGLEDPVSFFAALARREFPIGDFIRDARDLNYTPAPDVFHDLYGHLPFFADRDYADFCERFGAAAMAFAGVPAALRQFERVFWFGVEFPLIKTAAGRRIFGGGILSSYGESLHSLSAAPEVLPFRLDDVRHREFRIDEMQNVLFVLDHAQQLYSCVEPLVSSLRHNRGM